MAMPAKKIKYEHMEIAGNVDVLSYRLAEAAVKMLEHKIGIGGLWDAVKYDVSDIVNENFLGYKRPDWFEHVAAVVRIMRNRAGV